MRNQKKEHETICTRIKKHLDNWELNSKKLLKIATSIAFLFLVVICPVLNFLNLFSNTFLGRVFVIKESVSDWLSFWGSFSGTLATIFVGWATFRLTERIEREHQENEALQKQVTIVQNMPNMFCKRALLSSFNDCDYFKEHILIFPKRNNYCIFLEMSPAFPPYFDVRISEMQLKSKSDEGHSISIEKDDYSFTNHETFKLYINVPKKIEADVRDLYYFNLQTTNITPEERKKFSIRIRLWCSNTLLPEIAGNVEFDLCIELENVGHADSGVNLNVTNIQFLEVTN